jgi:hypothetical protein
MRLLFTQSPDQRRFHNFQASRAAYLRLQGHTVDMCTGTQQWLNYDMVLLDYAPERSQDVLRQFYAQQLQLSIATSQRRAVFYDDSYYPPQCFATELGLKQLRNKLVTDVYVLDKSILHCLPTTRKLADLSKAASHVEPYFALQPTWLPDDLPVLQADNDECRYAGVPKADRQFPDWVTTAKRLKSYEQYMIWVRRAHSNLFANSVSHAGQITPRLWESMFCSPCVFDDRYFQLNNWEFVALAPNSSREQIVQHQRQYMREYAARQLSVQSQQNVL